MQRLVDRVAIVTGGARGIGGATARRLADEGARVLVVDRDGPEAQRNAERIATAGGTAEAMEVDVGTADGVRAMVERAVERWGALHIVVNNAYSGGGRADAVATSEEAWDRAMDVGVKSMFRAAKFAVPHLRAAGGGAMVNISSVHGLLVAPGTLVYETVKPAVLGLTRQLAAEYGPDGIRVNAICPGHIVTERVEPQWQAHPEGLRFFEQQYPLRRTGRPVDIANAVVFLCSDEASFITGHTLLVDGGLTIQLQENLGVHLARYAQQNDTWFPY
jgi:meso-butanediol dehydrogenase / (S,S)-butanediol dehydrogenase / diacetyl reductase